MTITVAANNARIRYTATSSQTAFAIPFEFFENDEIHVYVASTALVAASERGQGTGSTEYGISGGGGSTGAIAFVTGITQGHIVTIVRDIPIERITDFTAGTTINRAALNTQLDTLTAMVGDLKDKSDRAIRLQPYDSEITLFYVFEPFCSFCVQATGLLHKQCLRMMVSASAGESSTFSSVSGRIR